eukprot:TRINITY_DN2158_c0_g1_i1.p1 TRINITY_DN2158_c0_g1~~TRINITY_DN2158_c0_g1_i1.p1  ORF type:complete len:132 (+),score=18.62 TRINITY_DN2158_c0_g1_i1:136-531(+)
MVGVVKVVSGVAGRARKAVFSVTDNAAKKMNQMLQEKLTTSPADKVPIGFRVGVKTRGCNGLSFTLDYADEKKKLDEVVEKDGIQILVDPKALLTIIGTEMDYIEDKLSSEFVFTNPNAKGTCGCGESFSV